ncbi:MAG: hypothetical protein LBT97_06775 [Planctomycetota bacterium]|jgi:hypothetical protein|nr:hypothetical protein [Planctomycetota bacterium]
MMKKNSYAGDDSMRDADVITITTENTIKKGGPGFLRRRFGLIGSAIVIALALWAIWSWGFCRFYVGPGEMAIITAKSGAVLEPGQILAKPGQKGVLEDPLGEGRHIWNPVLYDWEIVKAQFIPPGKVGIVTSLVGDPLPEGEFLAAPGQKGIWRKALGPGMYRLNPRGYSVEIIDAVSIPMGFVGVVTNLGDGDLPPEAFVDAAGRKGTRRDVLQPGIYYINPRAYEVDAVEVGVNQVSLQGQAGGVILTKSATMDENNQMMQRLNQNILAEQRRRREQYAESASAPGASLAVELMNDPGATARGVIRKQLPAAQAPRVRDGYAPVMEKDVAPAIVLDQFVNFPSRDGFDISLDMTVEFELRPEFLALIYKVYGDLPKVVDKTIMPQILSISRIKGSAYRAVDFIAGEGREKFQNDLTDALKESLGEKNIAIHSALIRNVNVPDQILEPLQVASLSRETELTNREKQNTARKQADLNREMSLIKQFGEQVMQETAKLKAEIDAEQKKAVAMIQADTLRRMAAIDRETAVVRAEKAVAIGKAEADALRLVEAERARGFGMKVEAFGADSEEYALYEFADRLNPELRINLIHAGDGTLWTDLQRAGIGDMGASTLLRK